MRITNKSPFKVKPAGYKISNKAAPDETTVYIYDEVSWFGVQSEQFVKDLNAISAKTIHIRLNSPGGSVFDGTAIFNAIKQHKSRTVAHIDGLAASISSVIALAADEVRMSENAFFMIHDPWSIVIGNADTMREEAELLDKVKGTIAKTYMDKSGKTADEINDMMSAETWLTADEAKELGFVDEIEKAKTEDKAQATLFDLSVFANVPGVLKSQEKAITEREIERALRDIGCTAKQAKAIVAEGFKVDLRDEAVENIAAALQSDTERDAVPAQRDVVKKDAKKDRVSALLARAEVVAPSL